MKSLGARRTSIWLEKQALQHGKEIARCGCASRKSAAPIKKLSAGVQRYCDRGQDSGQTATFMEETLKVSAHYCLLFAATCASTYILVSRVNAQETNFHNAPSSSAQQKNPYAGQQTAIAAGAKLYATNCAACHGATGQGTGNIPAVSQGPTQTAPDGEVFWFLTTGAINNGMPAWSSLSEQKRWQIVAYLKSLKNSGSVGKTSSAASATLHPHG
jgi:mono/diheme cytochrome c family protein